MTFLPKAFRTQEILGLLAAIPAAALGSACSSSTSWTSRTA